MPITMVFLVYLSFFIYLLNLDLISSVLLLSITSVLLIVILLAKQTVTVAKAVAFTFDFLLCSKGRATFDNSHWDSTLLFRRALFSFESHARIPLEVLFR